VTPRPHAAGAAGTPAAAGFLMRWKRAASCGLAAVVAVAGWALPADARALVFTIYPNTRTVYLQVGTGSVSMVTCWIFLRCPSPATNATINAVTVTVPAAQVGNGVAQAMTSNSTTTNSPLNGNAVCTAPQQVYVAAYLQEPLGVNSGTATLRVTTPAALTNGSFTMPFSQISWTRSAGTTATDIPAGTFSDGTQTLLTIAYNTWVENCLSFSYANTSVMAAGTFTGRATFTLTAL
jgi:hypothetical protein